MIPFSLKTKQIKKTINKGITSEKVIKVKSTKLSIIKTDKLAHNESKFASFQEFIHCRK